MKKQPQSTSAISSSSGVGSNAAFDNAEKGTKGGAITPASVAEGVQKGAALVAAVDSNSNAAGEGSEEAAGCCCCSSEAWSRWLARAFTASDIFCLMLQGGGGAMLASDDVASIERGRNLLLVGLALQVRVHIRINTCRINVDGCVDSHGMTCEH